MKSAYFLYGFVGIPLAFGALPLYMHLPKVYAENSSLSLAMIGALLWVVRLFDAITDPFFGALADYYRHKRLFIISLGVFLLAFLLVCHPVFIADVPWLTVAWLLLTLLITSISFSASNVVFLAWGASLGEDSRTRGQFVVFREFFTLIAVILAAVLPTVWGDNLSDGVKGLSYVCLVLGLMAIIGSLRLSDNTKLEQAFSWHFSVYPKQLQTQFCTLWKNLESRYLLTIFLFNGVASAIPATLFLFYVEDVLVKPQLAGIFLGLYFLSGVIALPIWAMMTPRFGRLSLWQVSMLLAMCSFTLAGFLETGDSFAFAVVCVLSGLALGADLSLPAAMASDCGERNKQSGVLFGWWNLLTKLNLAIAAGLALPLLSLLGYETGAGEDNASVLKLTYVALPITIKLIALWFLTKHRNDLYHLEGK